MLVIEHFGELLMSPSKVLIFLIFFNSLSNFVYTRKEIFLVLINQKYHCELLDNRVHH